MIASTLNSSMFVFSYVRFGVARSRRGTCLDMIIAWIIEYFCLLSYHFGLKTGVITPWVIIPGGMEISVAVPWMINVFKMFGWLDVSRLSLCVSWSSSFWFFNLCCSACFALLGFLVFISDLLYPIASTGLKSYTCMPVCVQ